MEQESEPIAPAAVETKAYSEVPPAPPPHADHAELDYVGLLFVFLLSTFVGLDVIRRVSRLLHTPLMSLTNAISAIAVVGAILVGGRDNPGWINALGCVAIAASVTNIVSGFLITDRMLKMFKQRNKEGGAK
jgi:NAD(P) transhydrogenase subunit alpha